METPGTSGKTTKTKLLKFNVILIIEISQRKFTNAKDNLTISWNNRVSYLSIIVCKFRVINTIRFSDEVKGGVM